MKKLLIIILIVFGGCMLSSVSAHEQTAQLATLPVYQFQSTSTCPSVIGQSALAPSVSYVPGSTTQTSVPRRALGGDPDEDPMGEIPIGSPWILLVLAILYALLRYHKQKLAKK